MFRKKIVIFLVAFVQSILVHSQDLSAIKNIDVASLSDQQIASYWETIREKGYTLAQIDQIAKVQGIPASKVAEFKARVNNLKTKEVAENKIIASKAVQELKEDSFGIKDDQIVNKEIGKSQLFGYDFFNNSKISFTPNINIAVPDSYQLGPGDELTIDLWGASEITYQVAVTKEGRIKIPGVGFIYVNGLSLQRARPRIIANLKKKYSGIGASSSDYSKIYTNISVSKIRTVQVSIIGEIQTPGTYAINSLASMLNAIYAAGGPTKMGSYRNIELIRNNKKIENLDVYEYLLKGRTNTSKLQDQDVLLVKPYQNLVTVEGAVKRPGIYELNPGETLANLLSYFGGFTPNSYTKLFVIERLVEGNEKSVKEVKLEDAASFKMMAGDKLIVQESLDIYSNRVSLAGEVYRPGNFELTPKMTLKDVIEKADGVTKDAFLERGLLVRTHDNFNKENISFSVSKVLDGSTTIELQKDDEIIVFNKEDLKEARTIQVSGAVNKPVVLDFVNKLQIEDAIVLAGGLTEGADPENISVSRISKDGQYRTLSKVFTLSSSRNLAINDGQPFYLEPYDRVVVRTSKGYSKQQSVTISGEVAYPGAYVLETKEDRISDLLSRSGGLTEFAYPAGATLKRKVGYLTGDLSAFEKIGGEENKEILQENVTEYSVAIDLMEILKNPKSEKDLLLRLGDEIVIPEKMQTVQVVGEVYFPSLVPFESGKSLKYYIANSGGFTGNAKRGDLAVQYSNGEMKTIKRFLFFKSYPRIEAGAKILVPKKGERKQLSAQEIIGITTSIATLGILIQTLTR